MLDCKDWEVPYEGDEVEQTIVQCDVVKCIYNNHCKCIAEKVEITLTHDKISKKEYIKCDTCQED